MSLQGQSRHFEDLNEARRQTGGHYHAPHPGSIWMRLRDVLAHANRMIRRFAGILVLSNRCRSRRRVASVDALRGFTRFWIIGADGAAKALAEMLSGKGTIPSAAGNIIGEQFEHAEWDGLRFYDLIFPLFIFVTGGAIVFSLTRLIEQESKSTAHWRVLAGRCFCSRCGSYNLFADGALITTKLGVVPKSVRKGQPARFCILKQPHVAGQRAPAEFQLKS
jgi:hypothetical protein